MHGRVLVPRLLMVLVLLPLLGREEAAGQNTFTLRLRGQDGSGGVDTLLYGRDPRATYCVDGSLPFYDFEGARFFQEFELPPAPPSGVFDFRFGNHRTGLGGCTVANERGNGLRYDIRAASGPAQIDTFQLKFQIGASGPMSFSWQDGLNLFCDSMRLKDLFGGILVNVDMMATQTYTVTNPAITGLYAIMYRAPGVPLLEPANGSTVPPSVTLTWTGVSNATRYRVQVATDSSFSAGTLIVHDSTLTTTSRDVTGLSSPATFFWRVAAGSARGWGAYSPTRFFRTGEVPAPPSPVAPPDGSTGQPTTLLFRWTASPGATLYHLQIASDSTFGSGFVVNDSSGSDTARSVSGLGFSTRYFWRVAALNGVGASTFSQRWSFTTQFQPPPAPILTAPANGAIDVSASPMLSWTSPGGASGITFRLQVATDAGFTAIVVDDSTITTTSQRIGPLQNVTQYFWKVTGRNLAGTGPSSETWNFTTAVAAPAAPVLLTPVNGATNVPLAVALTWGPVASATSYRLQLARDSSFTQITVDDSTLTGTARDVGPLLANTSYFWHVTARNAGGDGPVSSRFRFVTTAAPPLALPANGAGRVERTVRCVWGPVTGATGYHLQIATDGGFTTLLVNDSTIVDTARSVGPFPYGALLHWRVRSRGPAGNSVFSPGWSFTIMLQPPGSPVQVAPANNAGNQPTTPTLRWQTTPLGVWYHVEIALDTLMTNLVLSDSGITDTAKLFRVAPNTACYWRLRVANTEGTYGPYSTVRRFTTGNFAPATPVPFFPANGDTGVSRTPALRWLASPGALTYRGQIARDNLFTQVVAEDSLISTNAWWPPLLDANATYYWRVRARGTAGLSPYSLIQRFTTGTLVVAVGEGPPPAPSGFVLHQNYPNPFNPSTTVRYTLPSAARVSLAVYNMLGQEVLTLASGDHAPGTYGVVWGAEDRNGQPVPSGLYLIRMTAATDDGRLLVLTRKAVLMK